MMRLWLVLFLPFSAAWGTAGTAAFVGGVGSLAALLARKDDKKLFTPPVGSLINKTILITGASSGLGLESAKRLAVGGANLILTARCDTKGTNALQAVQDHLRANDVGYPSQQITYKLLDLDDLDSIRTATDLWSDIGTVDVLLNNAGIMAVPELELTVNNIERQMQSNHLGHFLLTNLLSTKLSEKARIINVSSEAHKFANTFDFGYMWNPGSDYEAWKSYGHSKLANIYFTQELQRRIDANNLQWTTCTLHPGVVATDLGRYVMGQENWENFKKGGGGFFQNIAMQVAATFLKTPEEGATTQIYLAAEERLDVNAQYFVDCKPRPINVNDLDVAARLWKESEERTGVEFTVGAKQTQTTA